MARLKNIVFIVVLLLCPLVVLHAQNVEVPKLKEIKGKKLLEEITPLQHKKGLWGYANSEGKFVIKPVFDEVCPFEENLARVCFEGKWGTISRNGLNVVTPFYDEIQKFSEDSLAIVKYDGKYGIMDAKGFRVQDLFYTSIDYADYGYLVKLDDLYGTVDKQGNTIFEPQFDIVVNLEKKDSVDMFFKDGKWGVMRAGRDILSHKWGKKLEPFLNGRDGMPNLYLASQNRKYGVVIPSGEYVVPCIYDDIYLASSGKYCITKIGDWYGAVNLKMEDLVPAVLGEEPVIGEEIYRTHNDGKFFCVNVQGAIDFRNCADLYYMFKPEEYITTKTFPEWAKTHIIEENVQARQESIEKARSVCEVMEKYNYDIARARYDKDLPDGYTISYTAGEVEKYGIVKGGSFVRSSAGVLEDDMGRYTIIYKGGSDDMYLVSDPSDGEYYIRAYGHMFPIEEMLSKFNVKQVKSLYPQNFAKISDSTVLVLFGFVRSAAEVAEPLVETNQYLMHSEPYKVNIHTGAPVRTMETRAAVIFNTNSLSAVSFAQMGNDVNGSVAASVMGGFFTYSQNKVIVDMSSPLVKYDRNGLFDWEFRPSYGDKFYDIEETENYVYLCGSTVNTVNAGVEIPMILQLDKRGKIVRSLTKDFSNARFSGIMCKDYLFYLTADCVKEKYIPSDFFPHFVLEDFGDNVGVKPHCVWEQWGDTMIGGCGLVSNDGKWLHTPALSTDQMCAAFDWEFSGFIGESLIVRHMGKYGVVNKDGVMIVDTKYDLLESLNNPLFIRAKINGSYGVIDVSGYVIVPVEYDFVGNMSEDIIVVSKDGLYGCYDKDGKLIVPLESEEIREYVGGMARIRQNRKFGFIDKNGEIMVNPFSDEVENFTEGAALVTLKNKKGFVTLQGDWITPPMYDNASSFSAGYAALSLGGKYGYIDMSGEFAVPLQFSDAKPFNPNCRLAAVATAGKWGVLKIREHKSAEEAKNNQYGKGSIVLPMIYDEVVICSDGYIYVKKDGKCGIFSELGQEIYPVVCDSIDYSGKDGLFTNGVVTARLNGELVRIDRSGNTVYTYTKYTTIK